MTASAPDRPQLGPCVNPDCDADDGCCCPGDRGFVAAPARDGGPVDDEAPTLAERQARYLAVRQHTLSTDGMDHDAAIVAQAEYVLGEAAELFVAVKRQEVSTSTPGQTAWHTRHEIADVVLAAVTLANLLGVTVEDCIDEKTEADRGRG